MGLSVLAELQVRIPVERAAVICGLWWCLLRVVRRVELGGIGEARECIIAVSVLNTSAAIGKGIHYNSRLR